MRQTAECELHRQFWRFGVLAWRGGDALTAARWGCDKRQNANSTGNFGVLAFWRGAVEMLLHGTDACAEIFFPAGQKIFYYLTVFRMISIGEGYPWSYKTPAV
jgi:hypothetical protein